MTLMSLWKCVKIFNDFRVLSHNLSEKVDSAADGCFSDMNHGKDVLWPKLRLLFRTRRHVVKVLKVDDS